MYYLHGCITFLELKKKFDNHVCSFHCSFVIFLTFHPSARTPQEEMHNRKPPLSECLRRVVHRLHLTLYYRGEYLNQLVEETQGRKLLLPEEEVKFDVDPISPVPEPMVGEPELVAARRLFMEAVDAACEECRQETRELYQREGKADQVTEGRVKGCAGGSGEGCA